MQQYKEVQLTRTGRKKIYLFDCQDREKTHTCFPQLDERHQNIKKKDSSGWLQSSNLQGKW